jgi:hypothetical protein
MASPSRPERDPDRPKKSVPAVAPVAAAPARAGKRMEEEDVGRPARARSGGGAVRSGGMGLGARVGLATGLLTLAAMAAALLPGMLGGKKGDPDQGLNEAGAAAVSALTAVEQSVWTGASAGPGTKEYDKTKRNVERLFGEDGRSWFEEQVRRATKVDPSIDDEDEKREAQQRAKRFEEARDALDKADAPAADPTAPGKRALSRVVTPVGSFDVVAAWVREGHADTGRILATSGLDERTIAVDFSVRPQVGTSPAFYADGKIGDSPVRVFGRRVGNPGTGQVTVYAALFRNDAPASGGHGLAVVLLLLGPLAVGLVGYLVANGQAQRMKGLAREIEKLGTSGDPTRSLRVQGAEATSIARAVERMVGNLEFRQQHAPAGPAAGAALGDLDEIVDRERKVAREIHDALINKHPPRLSDFEVEHLFKPGFEIGGDHFEYFRIDDAHLGVILLDTNVRGIPAALVMASARSYVRAAAPGNLSPASVLKQVNRHLAGELPPGRHVTAVYVVIDTAQGKATMASAGHLPVLVFRQASGKIAKINPAGIAMGLDVGPVFDRELQEGDVPLGPGDRLVLYTDGALRIANETGEEFGEQRFYAAVAREAPKNSQAFVNFVGSAIDQFHLSTPQNDDVTISTVKRLR